MGKSFSVTDHPMYGKAREITKKWRRDLNEARKEMGLSISEVLAMSQGNDPYWMTTGKVLKGFWAQNIMDNIIQPYLRANSIRSIHLRDVHYMLTSAASNRTWSNEQYLNTNKHWKELIEGFANARYLGFVDWRLIRDNKNELNQLANYSERRSFQEAVDMVRDNLTTETVINKLIKTPFQGLLNPWKFQPVHVEIWTEKDLAILEKVCYDWGVNYVVGEGETSVTQVYLLAQRIIDAGRPVRIGYVSDCDVVGTNMVKAMSRKLEFILKFQMGKKNMDVKVVPLMLTAEQVNDLGLPPIPMKRSKSKAYETRKDDWMDSRGLSGAVEINALTALHPQYFRDTLNDFIQSYVDVDKWNETVDLSKSIPDWIVEFLDQDDLDLSTLRDMVDDVDWDEVEWLHDERVEEMGYSELDYSDADGKYWWLLDTMQSYGEQLAFYDRYEGGELTEGSEDV